MKNSGKFNLSGLVIIFFVGIIMLITWQRVTIFKLGYEITELKQGIQQKEIYNQNLIQEARMHCSLKNIDKKARHDFNMRVPKDSEINIIHIDRQNLKQYDLTPNSLLAYVRNLFSVTDARAE